MAEQNENIEFKNIQEYWNHWDKFFDDWSNDKERTFNKDVIWNGREGKGETELEYDVFPQPYLGNIQNHSVITLNLNPSRSRKNKENIEFEAKHLPEFLKNPNDYYKYAESFPTYDIKFWQKQDDWIDRIFEKKLVEEKLYQYNPETKTKEKLKPFAIEICPWGSKSFQKLKINEDDSLIKYMDQHVFDVIEKLIEYSKLKIVLSVGKAYYDIFDNKKTDFELLKEISYKNNKPEGMDWPQTMDEKSGKDRDVKRTFSIWKKGKILYLNTYASGSNTPPADHFDDILNDLIKNHL